MIRKHIVVALITAFILATLAVAPAARAQRASKDASRANYPDKPLRIVVPFSAGGSADIFARAIGQKMTEHWNQQVVIDNRAGSGGVIGSEIAARAAPDGYTLMMGITANIAINPALYRTLPYSPVRDFTPVTLVASSPYVMVVPPSLPVKTAQDFIALAQARPGHLNYASLGNGSAGHLTGALFAAMAGIKLTHVPYKLVGSVLTDLMSGQLQLFFLGAVSAQAQIKGGRLRAIGVTGSQRSALLPDVPTVAEAGVRGYEVTGWYGVFVPARTPPAIVNKLNREIVRVLKLPDVSERFTAEGADLVGNTPDEFAAFITSEIAKWSKVVKLSGARED
ncbi:MAG: tripartite tricarboxylate transporter substrate binding protein [Burkholderiales bacterium]